MVFVLKTIDGEAPAGAEGADSAEEADADAEEAGADTVTVAKKVDPGAVTVTVWVAPTWPCALEADEETVGAALDCGCGWALDVDEAAAVLVASLLAGCDELPAGLPPTRYFGIEGLEIEVLKPAARVVDWESEAGTSLLVAEV